MRPYRKVGGSICSNRAPVGARSPRPVDVGAQNFVPKNVGAGFKPVPTRSPPRVGDIGGCEEVQDTSCQGFGGVPQEWGTQGVDLHDTMRTNSMR